ncbi:MAG: hypothetical protein HZB59_08960 [Ignavibacteriales bacterium]|nr:hypothetical protein [Ignavibacteriales bacterium]
MKPNNKIIITLLLPLLISLTGCLEEKVKTIISSDGSCVRTISMKLQSKNVPEKAFPLGSDGWTVEWKTSDDTSAPYEYTSTKSFRTPEEFRAEYLSESVSRAMRIDASIEKRFQWFYTYIDYNEKYLFKNPFGHVPVTDFLTTEEIEQFQRGENDEVLKKKVEAWIEKDRFEDIYMIFIENAEKLNDPAITASLLRENKEQFSYQLSKYDSISKANNNFVDKTLSEDQIMLTIFSNIATEIFGKAITEKLRPAVLQIIKSSDAKEKLIKFPDSWEYTTTMTGLLLESNGHTVQGNSVTWKFTPDQAKVAPYVMHASSRIVNVWAFIVTGGIILLLIILLVVSIIMRKRKAV